MTTSPRKTAAPRSKAALASALGIPFWVPRRHLAAAGQHPVLPLQKLPATAGSADAAKPARQQPPAAAAPSRSTSAGAAGQNRSNSAIAELREQMSGAPAAGSRRDANTSPQRSSAQPAATARPSARRQQASAGEFHFELCCTQLGELLVVDDVTQLDATPSAYAAWLEALALALRIDNKAAHNTAARSSARLAWPPANAPAAMPEDADARRRSAAEMLKAWLPRQYDRDKLRRVLLMGDAPSLLQESGPGIGSAPARMPLFDAVVLCSQASAGLWREPALKRVFWQQLCALRQAAER